MRITPNPIALYLGLRMLARWGGEFIRMAWIAGYVHLKADVFSLPVRAQVLIRGSRLHRRLPVELVRERFVFHHQLGVLARGLRQTLVHRQRLQAFSARSWLISSTNCFSPAGSNWSCAKRRGWQQRQQQESKSQAEQRRTLLYRILLSIRADLESAGGRARL